MQGRKGFTSAAATLTMAAASHIVAFFLLVPFISLASSSSSAADGAERKIYIVYMGDHTSTRSATLTHHLDLLKQVLVGCSPRDSLVYSYSKGFNGLAARLTTSEKDKLAGTRGVVSVFESRILKLRTTRSWDFLNFPQGVNRNPPLERDVVIGMLDTGIWPESKSFGDDGLGPPPRKWKGACRNFKCNNKIIGARFYNSLNDTSEEASPRDFEGHGTHTSSTAAGRSVRKASLFGLAGGTARGAVPCARLAVYKVCWSFGCASQDVLAAFDDAIADGVDIISLSLGFPFALDYFQDPIAIGAFHAMKHGILTSAAGGNNGPYHGSVSNVAPWMLVSAASSIDRRIIDKVITGDKKTTVGNSINTFPTEKKSYPFIHFGNETITPGDCSQLDQDLVKDKIVMCDFFSETPFIVGAKGAVMIYDFFLDVSFSFPIPTVLVNTSEGQKLIQYINETKNAVANIHKSEAVFNPNAPAVVSFSSRGPNIITPDILKPDISAPGVEILAAWSPKASMSGYQNDTRSVKYNIISGTSMACPHTTGAAAYVKSFHPSWSPAAIMSALVTTARPMNPSLNEDAELAYGSGQLNPVKAIDPGLVYDASEKDYVQMLCNSGYNKTMIGIVTGDDRCCSGSAHTTVRDLNYPSMAFHVQTSATFAGNFSRTVTNVGSNGGCKYTAKIEVDSRIRVTISPSTLLFAKIYEKKSFTVTVTGGPLPLNSTASAFITWSDGKHNVRSVLLVYTDFTI